MFDLHIMTKGLLSHMLTMKTQVDPAHPHSLIRTFAVPLTESVDTIEYMDRKDLDQSARKAHADLSHNGANVIKLIFSGRGPYDR